MPTTVYKTLKTVLAAFAKRSTSNLESVENKQYTFRIDATADTSSDDFSIFHADGPVYLKKIVFLPDIAIASSATEKVELTFFNASTDGSGTTELGSYSTYASDDETINAALVAFDAKTVYSPTNPLYLANDSVVRMDIDVTTASSINIQGLVVVHYASIIP